MKPDHSVAITYLRNQLVWARGEEAAAQQENENLRERREKNDKRWIEATKSRKGLEASIVALGGEVPTQTGEVAHHQV